jgi:GntR family transcriptional regulator, rspAB operon transcriptional repressor
MASESRLGPLKSVHLKDAAYDALLAAITNLDLEPGQAISENMLVEQLGVSKTPVRAALTRLEAEGMVETIPFKGTFVSTVHPDDARDVIELRVVLEVAAARLACERATPEELDRLMELAHVASVDEAAGEHLSALRDIGRFHEFLVELCGNRRLVSSFQLLQVPLMRISALSGSNRSSIEDSSVEHAAVAAAITAGDSDLAAELLSTHLYRVLDLYLASSAQPKAE